MRSFLVSRPRELLFLSAWIVGISAGMLTAIGIDDSILPVMRLAASCRVSIVVLFLMASIPFLITAFAVFIHQYPILLIICFVRSYGFGCLAWLIVRSFGSAAWLMQPMIQFSDGILLVVYVLYGLWHCSHWERNPKRPVLVCMFITAVVTIIDYLAVSPFLVSLLVS